MFEQIPIPFRTILYTYFQLAPKVAIYLSILSAESFDNDVISWMDVLLFIKIIYEWPELAVPFNYK